MRNNYKKDEDFSTLTKTEVLRRIFSYFKPYKKEIVLMVVFIAAASVIASTLPLFASHLVDVEIVNRNLRGVVITVVLALFLSLLWLPLRLVSEIKSAELANAVVHSIREETYKKVIKYNLFFFDNRPTGKILSRLTSDMNGLKEVTLLLTKTLVPNVLLLLFYTLIMLTYNPVLGGSVLLTVPLMFLGVYFCIIRNYKNWQDFRNKESNYKAFVHEDFDGIRIIQSFNSEPRTKKEAENLLNSQWRSWIKAVGIGDSNVIASFIIQGLGYLVLFIVAIKVMHFGKDRVGEVLAYVGYVGLFWTPIKELARMYNQLTTNFASASRVFSLQDENSYIHEVEKGPSLSGNGNVDFKGVSFAYPDEPEKKVLDDVSFSVEGGKTIALVGPTGAGKTTIVNLIARFYDPVKGEVLLDGVNIKDVTNKELRKTVRVMPQESALFNGTIRENLNYNNTKTDSEIKEACRKLNIDKMILGMKNGYDTEIQDAVLSQGQRQLIALARTLLSSPEVLILDEATSNVDSKTESLLEKGLKILMKGRTTFVVAHRLSTIRESDEIFVVDHGKIIERGNHSALMALGGEYRKLYMSQFKEAD